MLYIQLLCMHISLYNFACNYNYGIAHVAVVAWMLSMCVYIYIDV